MIRLLCGGIILLGGATITVTAGVNHTPQAVMGIAAAIFGMYLIIGRWGAR